MQPGQVVRLGMGLACWGSDCWVQTWRSESCPATSSLRGSRGQNSVLVQAVFLFLTYHLVCSTPTRVPLHPLASSSCAQPALSLPSQYAFKPCSSRWNCFSPGLVPCHSFFPWQKCPDMNGAGEHYAQWSQSVRKTSTGPYDFTHTWNLMSKIN